MRRERTSAGSSCRRHGNADGVYVWSAEYATTADRPTLSVTYVPPFGCLTNADCDDGVYCNGAETCYTGTGQCQTGTSVICGDAVGCTVNACDENLNTCTTVPDADLCDDGNPCTIDTCDIALDCQHLNSTDPCSDGDACTTGDVCSGGICLSGGPLSCDDGVACTDDSCSQATGCANVSSCPVGQFCNEGTGECLSSTAPPLPILAGATWKYMKGTVEPTPTDLTAWTRQTFDDQTWLSGASGFGYGADCVASRATLLTDMQNGYVSVYLRHAFFVSNPGRVTALTLTVDYDDAFVAYINGTEVARRNVTRQPAAPNGRRGRRPRVLGLRQTCNAAADDRPVRLHLTADVGRQRDRHPGAQPDGGQHGLHDPADPEQRGVERLRRQHRLQRQQPLHRRHLQHGERGVHLHSR